MHLQLLELHTSILSDSFKTFKKSALTELERDFEYVLQGLDKLYTTSTTLTREQVQKSSAQGDARIAKKVQGVRERNGRLKQRWHDQGKPIVRKQFDALQEALGTEYEDLKQKVSVGVGRKCIRGADGRWPGWTMSRRRTGRSTTA